MNAENYAGEQYTEGRLTALKHGNYDRYRLIGADGEDILEADYEEFDTNYGLVKNESDARRLVACWNACEGIETWLLESYNSQPVVQNPGAWGFVKSKCAEADYSMMEERRHKKERDRLAVENVELEQRVEELLAALKVAESHIHLNLKVTNPDDAVIIYGTLSKFDGDSV